MAHLNEREDLLAAWRALSGTADQVEGWRAIPVSGYPSIRAGRHFPGNEEAVLLGFGDVIVPTDDHLPQGKGFLVVSVDIKDASHQHWLALARRSDGSPDLFTTMVLDVLDTIRSAKAATSQQSFQLFLTRIRAWQDFMRRGADTMLGPQAEIGLFGELVTLLDAMSVGLHPAIPIEGWEGPLHGIQDFALGTGAIEVKTTIATTGFPASIESLDQLDDAQRQPLFLAAVRLRPEPSGVSLPELIDRIRMMVGDDPARNTLDTRLLHAGYVDATRDHYQRRYEIVEMTIIHVDNTFPRLTKATVPAGISAAQYDINLDQTMATPITMRASLEALGVL